jgi:hypothetical protein
MFSLSNVPSTRWSISLDVVTFTRGNICVALSKGRQGLPLCVSSCCDILVHIPHLPLCGDTSLLDPPSSLSILLSSLCEFIGFKERGFHEHKFNVTRPKQKTKVVAESDESDNKQHKYEEELYEENEASGNDIRHDSYGDY